MAAERGCFDKSHVHAHPYTHVFVNVYARSYPRPRKKSPNARPLHEFPVLPRGLVVQHPRAQSQAWHQSDLEMCIAIALFRKENEKSSTEVYEWRTFKALVGEWGRELAEDLAKRHRALDQSLSGVWCKW